VSSILGRGSCVWGVRVCVCGGCLSKPGWLEGEVTFCVGEGGLSVVCGALKTAVVAL
jgi:hypothetical protein